MTPLLFLISLSGILASVPAMSTPSASTTPEPEPCRRMTAALAVGDNRIFFFGHDYVVLNSDFKQIGSGNNTFDTFGVPYPEAAFVMGPYTYIFSDKYFFPQWNNYHVLDAELFGGESHGDFFKDGLDAGGNYQGSTYFFKGCLMMNAGANYISNVFELPIGIPCDLDAAISVGTELLMFKGDKMWHMPPGADVAEDPVQTSSVFQFDGIKLCAAD